MSIFKDQFDLEDLVQEIKKKSTALSVGPLQPNGLLSVEGPFPAIKLLKDFLLLKAKSVSEEDRRGESKAHQRPRRRPQQHRLTTQTSHFVRDADGVKQTVVLDTDVYHYMKHFCLRTLLANDDVVISDVTDGDTTTVSIEGAGSRSGAEQVLRAKEKIEEESVKLYHTLRKERIRFEERTRVEKERYKWVCSRVKPRYPRVLIIPYGTHIDVIGSSSEIFEFIKEVRDVIQSLVQSR